MAPSKIPMVKKIQGMKIHGLIDLAHSFDTNLFIIAASADEKKIEEPT